MFNIPNNKDNEDIKAIISEGLLHDTDDEANFGSEKNQLLHFVHHLQFDGVPDHLSEKDKK